MEILKKYLKNIYNINVSVYFVIVNRLHFSIDIIFKYSNDNLGYIIAHRKLKH